jgi:hypothetical protein
MDNDLEQLIAELPTLRREKTSSKFGQIPKSVEALAQLLGKSLSKENSTHVYSLILSECSRSRNEDLYLYWQREYAKAFPNEPVALCGLAHHLALTKPANQTNKNECIELARRAVTIAVSDNRLVRYSATMLIRTSLLMDDYAGVQEGLGILVHDAHQERGEDQQLEFDFLNQIDSTRLDPAILNSYVALASKTS